MLKNNALLMPIVDVQGQEINKAYLLKNDESKNIFVLKTVAASDTPKANVLILPSYAHTVHNTYLYANYLRENGYNVYRFDGINNVGLSSGSLQDYSLEQLEKDSKFVMNAILRNERLPLVVVALDTVFPIAVRLAAVNEQLKTIISVMGRLGDENCAKGFKFEDILLDLHKVKKKIIMFVATQDEYIEEDFLKCKEIVADEGLVISISGIRFTVEKSLLHNIQIAQMLPGYVDGNKETSNVSLSNMVELMDSATAEVKLLNRCEEWIKEKSL